MCPISHSRSAIRTPHLHLPALWSQFFFLFEPWVLHLWCQQSLTPNTSLRWWHYCWVRLGEGQSGSVTYLPTSRRSTPNFPPDGNPRLSSRGHLIWPSPNDPGAVVLNSFENWIPLKIWQNSWILPKWYVCIWTVLTNWSGSWGFMALFSPSLKLRLLSWETAIYSFNEQVLCGLHTVGAAWGTQELGTIRQEDFPQTAHRDP